MADGPYLKAHFEADLLALGEVPSFPPSELGRVDEQSGPIVLTNAIGRNAIVLFQETGYDFDDAVRKGNAERPVQHTLDDSGIYVTANAHVLNLANPYGLMAYFPKASDGIGDAAYYGMPEIGFGLPDTSRYITKQEATDLIVATAIPLCDKLFVSRPEAELSHYAYYSNRSCAQLSVESHAANEVPLVQTSVDPLTTEGAFELLEPVSIARNSFMQRLAYTGRAAVTGKLRSLPVYTLGENNALLQLSGITPGNVTFTPDNKGFFTYGYTERRAWNFDSLISMMRAQGDGSLAPLTKSTGIHKALESGGIGSAALTYTEVSAVPILYEALTNGPDTPYFQNLRRELGPAFDQESNLIVQARAKAHKAWQVALAGQERVEPLTTGLEEVAMQAGIRRRPTPR